MEKHKTLLFVGALNLFHGLMHIFQFLQSVILTYYNIEGKEHSWLHELLESPLMGFVWGMTGVLTLVIGYRDYKHHKNQKCTDHE